MPQNRTSWLVGAGAVIILGGLCVLAAGLGNHDSAALTAGTGVLSFGMLLATSGLYLQARIYRGLAKVDKTPSGTAEEPRNRKNVCDSCNRGDPVILCRVHHLHLCSDCLGKHYDFRSCAYIPSTRRSPSPKPGKRAVAHARGI